MLSVIRRNALVLGASILLATLVTITSVEAWKTSTSRREIAARLVGDFEGQIAFSVGVRVRRMLLWSAATLLDDPPTPGEPVAPILAARLARADSLSDCRCPPLTRITAEFGFGGPGLLGPVISHGESPEIRVPMDSLRAILLRGKRVEDDPHLLGGKSAVGPWLALLLERKDADLNDRNVFGVLLSVQSLRENIQSEVLHSKGYPIVAPGLLRGVPLDSAVRISLSTQDGEEFFVTGPETDRPDVATYRIGGSVPFVVRVGLSSALVAAVTGPGVTTIRRWDLLAMMLASVALVVLLALAGLRARALARTRQEFAVAMGHELRTPLTQLLLFAERLQLGRVAPGEEQRRAAGVLVRETRRLIHLVESILTVSRLERGTAVVAREGVALGTVITETIEFFEPLATEVGARITSSIPTGLLVWGDAGAIRQCVLNVLDNASRYAGHAGPIVVGAAVRAATVQVTIEDHGPGIPEAERDRVQMPFVRLGPQIAQYRTGTGMGLTIVRGLMVAMRGTCQLDSAPSGGLRVVLTFERVDRVVEESLHRRSLELA